MTGFSCTRSINKNVFLPNYDRRKKSTPKKRVIFLRVNVLLLFLTSFVRLNYRMDFNELDLNGFAIMTQLTEAIKYQKVLCSQVTILKKSLINSSESLLNNHFSSHLTLDLTVNHPIYGVIIKNNVPKSIFQKQWRVTVDLYSADGHVYQ